MADERTKKTEGNATKTHAERGRVRFRDRLPIPESVARALKPPASVAAGKASPWGGRALALVPLLVTLLFVALAFPRAAPPSEIPLPTIDERELAKIEASDRELADLAKKGLSDDTRILGSAIRAYFLLHDDDVSTSSDVVKRRGELNQATAIVMRNTPHEIKLLRAAQLEVFQAALLAFESTGVESQDLREVGGGFVRRMRDVGWMRGNRFVADRIVRAVLFKLAWNATLGIIDDPILALTRDELRALHGFYLRFPHVPEQQKISLELARKNATSPAACEETAALERAALEDFRLEKVKRLGAIDPEYPTAFAIGVVSYRRGRYSMAAEAFRDWLRMHPNGPLALRAQNHLKAAIAADERL